MIGPVKEALKSEGFGVLTQIDVAGTLKTKIGKDFRSYRILGACNPNLAFEALNEEANAGVRPPCNVVIQGRRRRRGRSLLEMTRRPRCRRSAIPGSPPSPINVCVAEAGDRGGLTPPLLPFRGSPATRPSKGLNRNYYPDR